MLILFEFRKTSTKFVDDCAGSEIAKCVMSHRGRQFPTFLGTKFLILYPNAGRSRCISNFNSSGVTGSFHRTPCIRNRDFGRSESRKRAFIARRNCFLAPVAPILLVNHRRRAAALLSSRAFRICFRRLRVGGASAAFGFLHARLIFEEMTIGPPAKRCQRKSPYSRWNYYCFCFSVFVSSTLALAATGNRWRNKMYPWSTSPTPASSPDNTFSPALINKRTKNIIEKIINYERVCNNFFV